MCILRTCLSLLHCYHQQILLPRPLYPVESPTFGVLRPSRFFFFFLSTCVTNDEKYIDFTFEDLRFPCPKSSKLPPSPPADYFFLNNWALLKHCLCFLASKGDTFMCGIFVQSLFWYRSIAVGRGYLGFLQKDEIS